jgi:branched-chain amino acid transport system substrate-binding protein
VAADGSTKPTVFRACFIDAFQGRAGARFASETLGASTAAVFLDEGDTYVTSLAEVFAAEFEAAGGQVVARESYASADGDFTEILSSVRDANPDVLYLPDYYDTVNLIARQAREMGIEAVLLGGDGWDSSDLDLGAMEGGYFTSHFSPDDDREVVQRFVAAYTERYGSRPDALAALAYDSVDMLIQAIAASGSDDPTAVSRTLATGLYRLVTGDLTFDAQHNPSKDAVIMGIEDGAVVYIATVPAD